MLTVSDVESLLSQKIIYSSFILNVLINCCTYETIRLVDERKNHISYIFLPPGV
jgi:hypothetical protein